MEQLEGKYFESTILALKKAKAGEKIEIRPEFKAALRAALEKKIAEQVPELQQYVRPGWAETVLKFKYLLAGVPVLAALALVATNLVNLKVNVQGGEIVPVALQPSNKVELPKVDNSTAPSEMLNIQGVSSFNPPIVTFSADSVMPPADILAKARERQQFGEGGVPIEQNNLVDSSDFSAKTAPTVKLTQNKPTIYTYVEGNTDVSTMPVPSKPIQFQNFAPVDNLQWNIVESSPTVAGQSVSNKVAPPQPPIRPELNGRVELNGKVQDAAEAQPIEVKAKTDDQISNVAAVNDNTKIASELSNASLAQPEQAQPQPQSLVQPILMEATDLTLAKPESYLDTAVEKSQLPQTPDQIIKSGYNFAEAMLPANVTAERINFQGERRPEIVAVLMKSLSGENGNLSADYYVDVKAIDDNQFKAVLFEFGQVKKVLILGQRDGELTVLTEISY